MFYNSDNENKSVVKTIVYSSNFKNTSKVFAYTFSQAKVFQFSKESYRDTTLIVNQSDTLLGNIVLKIDSLFYQGELDSLLFHYDSLYYAVQLEMLMWSLYDDSLPISVDTVFETENFIVEHDSKEFWDGHTKVTSKKKFGSCDIGSVWGSRYVLNESWHGMRFSDPCYTASSREVFYYERIQEALYDAADFLIRYDSTKMERHLEDVDDWLSQYPDSLMPLDPSYFLISDSTPLHVFYPEILQGQRMNNDTLYFSVDAAILTESCIPPKEFFLDFKNSDLRKSLAIWLYPEILSYEMTLKGNVCSDKSNPDFSHFYAKGILDPVRNSHFELRYLQNQLYYYRKANAIVQQRAGRRAYYFEYLFDNSNTGFSTLYLNNSTNDLSYTTMVTQGNCPYSSSITVGIDSLTSKLTVVDSTSACPEMIDVVNEVNGRSL